MEHELLFTGSITLDDFEPVPKNPLSPTQY